jgi:hypothetical protein
MSLALASRGYLCPQFGVGQVGAGPTITGVEDIVPDIDGAALAVTATPSISGTGEAAPVISGSSGTSEPPTTDGPVITGSGDAVPNIEGSEEE